MSAFLASPRFAELVICGVLVEAAALLAYRRRTGRGVPPGEVLSFLGAGLALLLALRAALPAAPGAWPAFAAAMGAALACHVWHLVQRWNS